MSIITNIFSSSKNNIATDYGSIITDFHSHLIPGIDDGCKTTAESLEIIRQFANMGFSKLITTPHIQDEFFKNTPEIILNGLEQLKKAVVKAEIKIQLEAAAEYLIDDGFEKKIKAGGLLSFGQKHILVEMSYFTEHPNLKSILFQLQIEGYKVILAHPERYAYWDKKWENFEELKDRGILFQLNTVSATGYYGPVVKKMAEYFINREMYDFMGSDMHNQAYMDAFQKSRFEKSIDKLMSSGKLKNSSL
jgi:tyrosine-protein phosphatase YwqE